MAHGTYPSISVRLLSGEPLLKGKNPLVVSGTRTQVLANHTTIAASELNHCTTKTVLQTLIFANTFLGHHSFNTYNVIVITGSYKTNTIALLALVDITGVVLLLLVEILNRHTLQG